MDRLEKYEAFVKDDMENNRGRLVNCYEELEYLLLHPKANVIFNKHYLNDLLTYATTFSPFYMQYKGFRCLEDFPIVNKQFLKDNWDKIAVPQYADYADNRVKFTSGSTGTPFKMLLDRYKHCRWIAGNKVFRAGVGVKSHERTLFISGNSADRKIPAERQERDNVWYMNIMHVDDMALMGIINYLKENNIRSMTGMASILEKLAHFIIDGKAPEWKESLLAVFSVSEHLKEPVRKVISEYFHCPCYVLYANEENGIFGIEDGSGLGCRANEADFYFEVLSMDSDKPVAEGELGRLVITDLFNRAFPIIRYENGDLVSMIRNGEGKLYIKEIAGRQVDALYTTDGRMVHYFEAISFLEPYMDIRQFQLIQYDYNRFKWVLNTDNHSYEDMIVKYSKGVFGDDSEYEFEYVDDLPKLRSGKIRMTMCLIPGKN